MEKDYFNGKSESDKKIIHLYVLDKCSHHCKLCCNKEYDTMKIPVVSIQELQNAEMICLTGGEPFLLDNICDFAEQIKKQFPNIKQIFVYTCGDSLYHWLQRNNTLHGIDGVNISPKNKYDTECVVNMFSNKDYRQQLIDLWSNRIYVFPNIDIEKIWALDIDKYESINIMRREWQEEFEPDSGIFRRLPILFN